MSKISQINTGTPVYSGLFRRILAYIIDVIMILLAVSCTSISAFTNNFLASIDPLYIFISYIPCIISYLAISMIMLFILRDRLIEIVKNVQNEISFVSKILYIFVVIFWVIISIFLILLILNIALLLFNIDLLINRSLIFFLYFFTAIFLYIPLMESSKYQGTLGQIIMGIKIISLDKNRISFIKSLLRLIVFFIFNVIHLGIISGFFILLSKEKKALHDIACDTRVILKNNPIHQ